MGNVLKINLETTLRVVELSKNTSFFLDFLTKIRKMLENLFLVIDSFVTVLYSTDVERTFKKIFLLSGLIHTLIELERIDSPVLND